MNDEEFQAVKATMPWTERMFRTPKGGLVQVIDKNGAEVPMFTMTRFLVMITNKIAAGATEQPKAETPTPAETTA